MSRERLSIDTETLVCIYRAFTSSICRCGIRCSVCVCVQVCISLPSIYLSQFISIPVYPSYVSVLLTDCLCFRSIRLCFFLSPGMFCFSFFLSLGNWIHAVDVEQDYLADFPSFGPTTSSSSLFLDSDERRRDRRGLLCPSEDPVFSHTIHGGEESYRNHLTSTPLSMNFESFFSSSSSSTPPSWRVSSISNVIAVGESSTAGCFSLLQMDLRCPRPVVQEIRQTRRMLWPLRVHGYSVFVSSVFAGNELCGRIRQIDLRYERHRGRRKVNREQSMQVAGGIQLERVKENERDRVSIYLHYVRHREAIYYVKRDSVVSFSLLFFPRDRSFVSSSQFLSHGSQSSKDAMLSNSFLVFLIKRHLVCPSLAIAPLLHTFLFFFLMCVCVQVSFL